MLLERFTCVEPRPRQSRLSSFSRHAHSHLLLSLSLSLSLSLPPLFPLQAAGGVRTFYRGNVASALRHVPYSGVRFYIFETLRTSLNVKQQKIESHAGGALAALRRLASGVRGAGGGGAAGSAHVARGTGPTPASAIPGASAPAKVEGEAVVITRHKVQRQDRTSKALTRKGDATPTAAPGPSMRSKARGRLADLILLGFCGSVAGIAATLVSFPLDLIRSRQIVSSVQQWPYSGPYRRMEYRSIASAVSTIYTRHGLMGFYSGLSISLLGVIPLEAGRFGIFFTLLESLKELRNGTPPSAPEKLLCGYFAGTFSIFMAYPFDCVRRRMQVEAVAAESIRVRSAISELRHHKTGSSILRGKQGGGGRSGAAPTGAKLEPMPLRGAASVALSILREHPRNFFRGFYLVKLINPIRTAITFTCYTNLMEYIEEEKSLHIDDEE